MKSISDNDIENSLNINLLQLEPIHEPLCGRVLYIFILSSFSITLIVLVVLFSTFRKV